MRKPSDCILLSFLALLLLLPSLSSSHGLLSHPPQRGLLRGSNRFASNPKKIYPSAPTDGHAHFPAGDKSAIPGKALESQKRHPPFFWTPFEPLNKTFVWRAGVCGDMKSGPEKGQHMRGGEYYYNGTLTANYQEGGVLRAKVSIIGHHNGFVEFHVCDVSKCGGEISEQCFRDGHCYALKRVLQKKCERKKSTKCGPVDRNFPGRWYLPCKTGEFDVYDNLAFRLPEGLSCEHCVLHWFWSAANDCNPPGVKEYFEGDFGPKWGTCKGQGAAVGGYSMVQADCGLEGRYAEEYYQCADISIGKKGMPMESVSPSPGPSPASVGGKIQEGYQMPTPSPVDVVEEGSVFRWFEVLDMEGFVDKMQREGKYKIGIRGGKVAVEAVSWGIIDGVVEFWVDEGKVWIEKFRPYVLGGNKGRIVKFWEGVEWGKWIRLEVRGGGGHMGCWVKFYQKE